MSDTVQSSFEKLAKINVNDKIEKKNGLSYLSWAWALDQLMRCDPEASWEYPEPKMFGETMMVYCSVTAFSKVKTAHLPVMDHRNKPIPNPDAFQVNTAMQRCLVKAIALHGLGLYIYAGEDLPEGEEAPKEGRQPIEMKAASGFAFNEACYEAMPKDEQEFLKGIAGKVGMYLTEGADLDAYAFIEAQRLDDQEKPALWHLLDSKQRTAIKKAGEAHRLQQKAADAAAERKAA
jgi:hypothetical protein